MGSLYLMVFAAFFSFLILLDPASLNQFALLEQNIMCEASVVFFFSKI